MTHMISNKTNKERPILFSGPMVRAILEGRKTQTRRVAKLTTAGRVMAVGSHKNWHPDDPNAVQACPYGQPADRLWVRETHCYFNEANELVVAYRADEWTECPADDGKWKPSIFCTRAASRITLEITAVRVERLQDITDDDAVAEGVEIGCPPLPTMLYERLWETINGPDSWTANPWVWVIEFKAMNHD